MNPNDLTIMRTLAMYVSQLEAERERLALQLAAAQKRIEELEAAKSAQL